MTKKTYITPVTEIIITEVQPLLGVVSLGRINPDPTTGDGHGGGMDFSNIDDLDNPTTPNAPIMLWEEIGNIEDKGRRIAFFE